MGPRIFKISFLALGAVLWLKKIEDLSVLIFCPNAASYCYRISTNL